MNMRPAVSLVWGFAEFKSGTRTSERWSIWQLLCGHHQQPRVESRQPDARVPGNRAAVDQLWWGCQCCPNSDVEDVGVHKHQRLRACCSTMTQQCQSCWRFAECC